MIAYRAMVDVPGEMVAYLARLLAAERRALGTRRGTRVLSCAQQALLVLGWFRTNENIELLAAGFGVAPATGYRYIAEGRRVLAAQAPDLHDALRQVAEQGWAYVVLDGSLTGTDRCAQTTTSVKGDQIDAWYSGKHRRPEGNIQASLRPDGLPIWISDVLPSYLHDVTCAEAHQMLAAACWAASHLHLPTLADAGCEGAGIGVYTPVKQPTDGRPLAADNRAYNTLLRAARAPGERGYTLLKAAGRSCDTSQQAPPPSARSLAARSYSPHSYMNDNRNAAEITLLGSIS